MSNQIVNSFIKTNKQKTICIKAIIKGYVGWEVPNSIKIISMVGTASVKV